MPTMFCTGHVLPNVDMFSLWFFIPKRNITQKWLTSSLMAPTNGFSAPTTRKLLRARDDHHRQPYYINLMVVAMFSISDKRGKNFRYAPASDICSGMYLRRQALLYLLYRYISLSLVELNRTTCWHSLFVLYENSMLQTVCLLEAPQIVGWKACRL